MSIFYKKKKKKVSKLSRRIDCFERGFARISKYSVPSPREKWTCRVTRGDAASKSREEGKGWGRRRRNGETSSKKFENSNRSVRCSLAPARVLLSLPPRPFHDLFSYRSISLRLSRYDLDSPRSAFPALTLSPTMSRPENLPRVAIPPFPSADLL